ncbi:MAG: hypothetical protein JO110_09895 [Acetobacteraceae bacterium]|nr:hypothetical protein [Acetobacteraceae bacterium]
MHAMTTAARAYQNAASHRGVRAQEADVFRRANVNLHAAKTAGPVAKAKALADNHRLWISVVDLLRDPANTLPKELRASIVSVGLAVQREAHREEPDFGFLISVNESIAAGLEG